MKRILLTVVLSLVLVPLILAQTCVSGNCQDGYGSQTYTDGGKYDGFFKSGLRDGQGTYVWPGGSKYTGEWKAGKLSGYGTYVKEDGTVQTGYWEDAVFKGNNAPDDTPGCKSGDCDNGYGVRTYDDGGHYEGYFKNGLREGQGTFTWKEGEKFVGQWVAGDYTGYGTYYYSDGTQKTGYWNKNQYVGTSPSGNNVTSGNQTVDCQSGDCSNGYGVRTYEGGGRYEGNFKNNLRDGEGTFTWKEGDKFLGHWVAGDYTGYGTYYYSNGTQQTGYWNKNVYIGSAPDESLTGCLSGNCNEGFGIKIYDGGGRYEGNFTGGLRNGQGTYYWKEGEKYTGEWTSGLLTGIGTYYYANGTSKFGYWENSEYKGTSRPGQTLSTGCISGNCNDGYGVFVFDNGDRYEGSFKNNNQNGFGTYTWASGNTYAGNWIDGKQNGQGKKTFTDGYIQDGYWKDGSFTGESEQYSSRCISGDCDNGYGTYTWDNGEKYQGYWNDIKRNGQGTNYYANGDVYTGNWKNDQQDGFGTMKFHNSDVYVGDWKLHKKDGTGTYTYATGEKYTGEWKNDQFDGQGTYYNADGTSKTGMWHNNEFQGERSDGTVNTSGCVSGNCDNGFGTYVFPDGEKYVGYWVDGKRNGQGTNTFANGAVYTGEWRDDLKHGYGQYKYPASKEFDYYTGYWENDKFNGRGTLVYRNGQKYEGSFRDYQMDGEGTLYNNDGTIKSGIWKEDNYVGKSLDNYGCISGDCNNGFGTYSFESGEKYVGNFKNGEYSGTGTYYFSNGDKYTGEFKNSEKDGQGTYIFASDSRKYVGGWTANKYNGYGTMYYANGTVKAGNWKDDQFLGELNNHAIPPQISWITPEYYATSSSTANTVIKACIKSTSDLKNASLIVNGQVVADKLVAGPGAKDGDCAFTLEKTITLKEGDNQIEISAENLNGESRSEVRNVSYTPNSGSVKYALLIGNDKYTIGTLKNPVNDATAMSKELKQLGFNVILVTDGTRDQMIRSIRSFGEKIKESKGIGLFYYAGHGIQMNGDNYIIPSDAKIEKEQDVDLEAVNLNYVMGEFDYAQNQTNIVILDACRNNPFARSFRSAGNNGLATVSAPQGTFIAYATAPGSVASDGSGSNGLYTQELLAALQIKGLKIEDLFKKVRSSVYDKSNKQQVPWENSSLFTDFYFNK